MSYNLNCMSQVSGQFDDADEDFAMCTAIANNHLNLPDMATDNLNVAVKIVRAEDSKNSTPCHLHHAVPIKKRNYILPLQQRTAIAHFSTIVSLPPSDRSCNACYDHDLVPNEITTIHESDNIFNDDDVLSGRGKGPSNYIGNRRFRELVMKNRLAYSAATKRKEKKAIARQIVAIIISRGGQFLSSQSQHRWVPLNEKKALAKVSQALRECALGKWNAVRSSREKSSF